MLEGCRSASCAYSSGIWYLQGDLVSKDEMMFDIRCMRGTHTDV